MNSCNVNTSFACDVSPSLKQESTKTPEPCPLAQIWFDSLSPEDRKLVQKWLEQNSLPKDWHPLDYAYIAMKLPY